MPNQITIIREKMGISQEYFAILLGVSRAALSLAELGSRSLPTFALEKLAALSQLIPENMQPGYMPPQKITAIVRKAFTLYGDLSKAAAEMLDFAETMQTTLLHHQQQQTVLETMWPNPDKGQKLVLDLIALQQEKIVKAINPQIVVWCKQLGEYLEKMPAPPGKIT